MPQGYERNTSKRFHDHDGIGEAAARDAGIARALGAQPRSWVNCAKLALKQTALDRATLTADHVWAKIEELGGGSAANNSAMAGVLKWGEGLGYVRSTTQSALSTRDGRHRSRIAVWESRIYREPTPERTAWREAFGI